MPDGPESRALAEAESLLEALAASFLADGGPAPARPAAEFPNAEERYRTLVEQIPAVVFMAFLEKGLSEAYVSPQIEAILGFTQEEWLGDPVLWYRQLHPDDKARWSLEAAQLMLTGEALRSDYRVLSRDGRTVWFHCEAKMVRDRTGRPWFIHGVGFDITDMKETERALEQARDELELRVAERTEELARSNAELEQFAYVSSHDLQEPLRVVAGFAQLLAKRYQGRLDADADELIAHITSGVGRMRDLIHDLLDYSRVGSRPKSFARVEMRAVLERVLESLHPTLAENGAVITHDALPEILGNEEQLVRVFQNLIANAIKFRGPDAPRIHISAVQEDRGWKFAVRDNGIGLEPEHQARIFEMFQRLHTREEYPGTGIGLAITKKIVDHHGGRIWVESAPGAGSTFFLTVGTSGPKKQERMVERRRSR